MKKYITALGLGVFATIMSLPNAKAMENVGTDILEVTLDVNLRSEPDVLSSKISVLNAGSKVKLLEKKGSWYKVKYKGFIGWVSSHYLTSTVLEDNTLNQSVSDVSKAVKKNTKKQSTCNGNSCSVRGESRLNANKILSTDLSKREKTVIEKVKKDVVSRHTESAKKVTTKSGSKIDSKKHLSNPATHKSNIKTVHGIVPSEGSHKTTNNKQVIYNHSFEGVITNTSFLNVRKGPSTAFPVLGSIRSSDRFRVISKTPNGWHKVVLSNGIEGFASGKFIKESVKHEKAKVSKFIKKLNLNPTIKKKANNVSVTSVNTKSSTSSSRLGFVNSSVGLNVRETPSMTGTILSTLGAYSNVTVIETSNGWSKIQLSDNTTGYVGASYISYDMANKPNVDNNTNTQSTQSKSKTTVFQAVSDDVSNSIKANNRRLSSSKSTNSVVNVAKSLIRTPYVWGGSSLDGFDCSGFTQYVYRNAVGVEIPRVSRDQANFGKHISLDDVKEGDLLYFDTMGSGKTSHVGIYMGDGNFIHASGSATDPECVKISNLSESWVKCLGARRVY